MVVMLNNQTFYCEYLNDLVISSIIVCFLLVMCVDNNFRVSFCTAVTVRHFTYSAADDCVTFNYL